MGFTTRIFSHIRSGASTEKYYKSMNEALARLNQEYTMLHYPYHVKNGESFLDAQKNLTDYCMSLLPPVRGKHILEIGCGNGIQANYILKKFSPASVTAIDLNNSNIEIARLEAQKDGIENISFHIDDAQRLDTIETNSIDYIINIESAFHYPDKPSFLREISRVLKPGGTYLIADVLTTRSKRNFIKNYWKRRMNLHHWLKSNYEEELPKANLKIETFTDITGSVIESFSNYRHWLKTMERENLIDDLLLKLYYTIHVRLNIHLLRNRRQYCVIVGGKQAV
ncbi:MAG: class I SAM-dependent methyltransferase [Bacteroidota bacterium]